jgi:methionine-rich copper-binding protein CopC
MMSRERRLRLAVVAAMVATAVLLLPGAVLGHAELETPTPADKSTVTEPVAEVSGIYSESMQTDGSSLVVKDASGAEVAKGTVDPEDDTRMVATPATPLGNGTYLVESTTLSTDGDIAHATWTFTVAIAATPSPSPTATTAPTASAAPSQSATPVPATATPSLEPTAQPSGEGTATGSGSDVVLPIIVALIVLGAGAAYLLTRRNRPTDAP